MKITLTIIFSTFFCVSCITQKNSIFKKNDAVLNKITNEVCLCYNKISNKSENDIDKLLIRECLEEATKQNLKEVTKYYNVTSFKEINREKYFNALKPKITKECKLSESFVNESFETISSE